MRTNTRQFLEYLQKMSNILIGRGSFSARRREVGLLAHPARLGDHCSTRIAELHRSREFDNAGRLPSELVLANRSGVSRPVVRRRFRTPCSMGVIVSRKGPGSYIRKPSEAQPPPRRRGRVPAWWNSLAEVRKCYEFRVGLEGEAAHLAACISLPRPGQPCWPEAEQVTRWPCPAAASDLESARPARSARRSFRTGGGARGRVGRRGVLTVRLRGDRSGRGIAADAVRGLRIVLVQALLEEKVVRQRACRAGRGRRPASRCSGDTRPGVHRQDLPPPALVRRGYRHPPVEAGQEERVGASTDKRMVITDD